MGKSYAAQCLMSNADEPPVEGGRGPRFLVLDKVFLVVEAGWTRAAGLTVQ